MLAQPLQQELTQEEEHRVELKENKELRLVTKYNETLPPHGVG